MALSTLGCKVNQYESAGILEALDTTLFSIVPFNTKADCYIINTCTVTGRTDYQSRQLIRRAIKTNPDASIIVTGCYAQITAEEIARIPGITLITGTAEKEKIPCLLKKMAKGNPQIIVGDIGQVHHFSGLSPKNFPGHTRAFLKIQDGCNSYCSYCIVPYARGRSRSLHEEEVINQIETLARSGYREIVLTGIHLGIYGQDLLPPSTLLNILRHVNANGTVERLRLSSIEITEVSDDIIRLMADSATICRHLHIPLQSGDDRTLVAMMRSYDAAFFRSRLEEIYRAMPDIAIGLDVMAGFPGEGEEAFENTLLLIDAFPVAYIHVFPYSDRPGTAASRLPGAVREDEKKKRVKILRDIGQKKRNAFAERFMEKKLSVLVEDKKDRITGFMKGYSDSYIPVLITDGDFSLSRQIVNVIPDYAREGRLFGRTANHDG
ncbi:MAG: tRNA (N(6)-L-threonylcarbamoyladenosine(37)-C(2))-methylthiotransferase MtaB [Deltaproteobacteria bacterium]